MSAKMVYLTILLPSTSWVDPCLLQLQPWNKAPLKTNNGLQVLTLTHRCQQLLLKKQPGMNNNSEAPNLSIFKKRLQKTSHNTKFIVSMVITLTCHLSLTMEVLFKLKLVQNHHMTLLNSISQINKSLESK